MVELSCGFGLRLETGDFNESGGHCLQRLLRSNDPIQTRLFHFSGSPPFVLILVAHQPQGASPG